MPGRPKITKAVIPAAGFGTRMLPATKALPKEMLPVAGKPLVQYAVEEAAASGMEVVILVVGDHKSLIQAHFARDLVLDSFLEDRQMNAAAQQLRRLSELADLRYVEQKSPLGLAHAISCAQPLLSGEPFVVLLPDVIMVNDDPVTQQLIHAHQQHGGSVVAIREVGPQDVQRHGIVRVERHATLTSSDSVRVTGLVEKPSAADAPSRLGVFGRYLLEPAIWEAINKTDPDPRGEVQLTDALNLFSRRNLLSGLCFEGWHFDAGDPLGYLQANIELSLGDPRLGEPVRNYLSCLHARMR